MCIRDRIWSWYIQILFSVKLIGNFLCIIKCIILLFIRPQYDITPVSIVIPSRSLIASFQNPFDNFKVYLLVQKLSYSSPFADSLIEFHVIVLLNFLLLLCFKTVSYTHLLALMDAGVPITAPVAGISCGLITAEDSDDFMTMIDIQGLEDFYGDMDFKVAGTHKGITSIQMDIKIDGLTPEIIREAFEVTHKGRDYIIDEILLKAIPEPRKEVSKYAPKMLSMKISVDKIREVIGTGGKVIQKIVADTGAKIDIEEDGTIFISSVDQSSIDEAKKIIDGIVFEPEVGEIYEEMCIRDSCTGEAKKRSPPCAKGDVSVADRGIVYHLG